jgi:hypothetical protein
LSKSALNLAVDNAVSNATPVQIDLISTASVDGDLMNCAEMPNRNTPGNTATSVNIPDSRRAICEPNTPLLLSRMRSRT